MSEPHDAEPRRHLPVPIRVEIFDVDANENTDSPAEGSDYAVNFYPGGMCVQTRNARVEGDRFRIRFTLEPGSKPIEAECQVVWCGSDSALFTGCLFFEMGVRFLKLSRRGLSAIDRFVRDGMDQTGPQVGM